MNNIFSQDVQKDLTVDSNIQASLHETSKWASFIAIIGFIGIGLITLVALFFILFGASVSAYGGKLIPFGGGLALGIIYLLLAALYFFPIRYLYRFASEIKTALNTGSQVKLSSAFENLKSHYKFIGILIIVMIALYVLIFAVALLSVFGNL